MKCVKANAVIDVLFHAVNKNKLFDTRAAKTLPSKDWTKNVWRL